MISLLCFGIRPYAQGLPKVIPPTPDVAALGQFGEYPVATNYGTIPVSIPLFELTSGDITVPVHIAYHTGGIKVNQEATSIGLGWSLNAGGTISKSVRGADDRSFERAANTRNTSFLYHGTGTLHDYINVKPTLTNADTNPEVYYMDHRIISREVDGQSDTYFFNFLDHSGKFAFKGGGLDDVLIYPLQQNLKFQFRENVRPFSLGYMDGFYVRDDQGMEYWFEDQENVVSTPPEGGRYKSATAWQLSRIYSNTSDNYVIFAYDDFNYAKWNYSYYNTYGPNVLPRPPIFESSLSTNYLHHVSPSLVEYETKALKEIRAHNGTGAKLIFETVEDRQDVHASKGFRYNSITLVDKNGQQIKKATFHQSYFTAGFGFVESFVNTEQGKKRMRLDSVTITGRTDIEKQVYRFDYHSRSLPHINSLMRDYWGYYNGKDATKILPSTPYTNYTGADLTTNRNTILAGSLQRIHYPTGGYTEFEFESNEVLSSGLPNDPPPDRITRTIGRSGICLGDGETNFTEYVDVQGVVDRSINVEITFPDIPVNAFGTSAPYPHPRDIFSPLVRIFGAGEQIWLNGDGYQLDQSGNFYKHEPVVITGRTFQNANTGNQDLIIVYYNYHCGVGDHSHNAYGPFIKLSYGVYNPGGGSNTYNAPSGGLRIKKLTNMTENGIAQIKEYDYNDNNDNSTGKFVFVGGLPILSHAQQAYRGGTDEAKPKGVSAHPITRVYDHSQRDLGISGSIVCYGQVTETIKGAGNQSLGKTVYTYNTLQNTHLGHFIFPMIQLKDQSHKRTLVSKKVYNEDNQLVHKDTIVNTYTVLDQLEQLEARGKIAFLQRTHYDIVNSGCVLYGYSTEEKAYNDGMMTLRSGNPTTCNVSCATECAVFNNQVYADRYTLSNEYMTSSQVTTTRYDTNGNNPIATVTTNTYGNPAHLQVTSSDTRNLSGDGSRTKMHYPDDIGTALTLGGPLDATDASVIGLLRGDNRKTVPIQTEIYELEGLLPTVKLVSVQRNLYGSFGGMLLPKNVQTAKGNDNVEPRIVHYGYDAQGNPQEVSREDGAHLYYIWGYNKEYPIAKLENFTSSDAATVQTLINAAVTASDADNDNCSDASCKEQQLRNALKAIRNHSVASKAMVTTYTYDPLVGITSITDPKGYTTYYEYDDSNRLKSVKDAGNNLVTDYEYHYKN